MECPFPGMNPYLEQPSMWPDVHHRLITAISDQLQERIAPGYRAIITPYVVFESIEIAPVRSLIPDVGVFPQGIPEVHTDQDVAVLVAPPLTLPAIMEVPTEYARIEIRTVRDHTLITAIELLSPANKRAGAEGAEAYEKKRQELFRSTAHLLEIDLLRAGRRPQVARPLPAAPYFVFLSRVQRRPYIDIWPLALNAPIPRIAVPLRAPDADVALDVGAAIQTAYRRARYDLEVDYRVAPPPPDLSAAEATWLDAHLREQGLRG
jgi:hypothetical protein